MPTPEIEELVEALKVSRDSLGRNDYCRCNEPDWDWAAAGSSYVDPPGAIKCTVHFVDRVIKKYEKV